MQQDYVVVREFPLNALNQAYEWLTRLTRQRRLEIAANIDIALVFAAAVLFDQMVNDTMGV